MTTVYYNQYENIRICATKYRGYKPVKDEISQKDFQTNIQFDQYVKLSYVSSTGTPILIYLFSKTSKYIKKAQDFRSLMSNIKGPHEVILVTPELIPNYVNEAKRLNKHLDLYNYPSRTFNLIIPQGPLCFPHRVMTQSEVKKLCNNELFNYITSLPKINVMDPQCIWINAKVGDVLEIIGDTDSTGKYIKYALVIPKNEKFIAKEKDAGEETMIEPVEKEVPEEPVKESKKQPIREDDEDGDAGVDEDADVDDADPDEAVSEDENAGTDVTGAGSEDDTSEESGEDGENGENGDDNGKEEDEGASGKGKDKSESESESSESDEKDDEKDEEFQYGKITLTKRKK